MKLINKLRPFFLFKPSYRFSWAFHTQSPLTSTALSATLKLPPGVERGGGLGKMGCGGEVRE